MVILLLTGVSRYSEDTHILACSSLLKHNRATYLSKFRLFNIIYNFSLQTLQFCDYQDVILDDEE